MEKIRFGIIGCGAVSQAHIEAIKSIPEAELVAVADVVEEKAVQTAARWGCKAYGDYNEMLATADIQVVNICTGSGVHMEPAVAAAKAGKHVIVEKPLEVTLERADAIIRACRENGVKLACIFQSRFTDCARFLYDAIQQDKFGRLVAANAFVPWYRDQHYYDASGWRGTWRFDGGGALMNQGIHSVDMIQWLMGPVKAVKAYTGCLAHERLEVEDLAAAVLQFAGGALGVIQCATSFYPGYPKRLEIYGALGSSIAVDDRVTELNGDRFTESEKEELFRKMADKEAARNFRDPMAFSFEGHKKQIEDLIRAIKEDRRPFVDGEEARKSIEIIMAIYKSAAEGGEVELPLKEDPEHIKTVHGR